MSLDPVVIYHAASPHQAHLLQRALAEVGLESWVESPVDNHLGQSSPTSSPRVVVRRADAEEARRIAEEFDRLLQLPAVAQTDDTPARGLLTGGEVIEAWPVCPKCQAPRQAECLACQTAADHFAPAWQPEGAASGLWMCPSCDDVFEPRFFRRCHLCGHDYGAGYEPRTLPRTNDHERRAWLVLWTMLAIALLIGVYFSWIFRR